VLLAEIFGLPADAGPYAAVIGVAFLVGIYANAAKMPRLLAVAIAVVLVASLVAILVSFSYDGTAPRTKP
jgi:hypothetical protein